jgi:hypothetical protein
LSPLTPVLGYTATAPPAPSSPCARSRPLHPYKRKYPPCRDQSSAPPSSSAPIALPLAPAGTSRRIRGRGRHELDGEACAGEWRSGAESSTGRRARERGGNMCHALFLHRSRAATNNTCRMGLPLETSFVATVVFRDISWFEESVGDSTQSIARARSHHMSDHRTAAAPDRRALITTTTGPTHDLGRSGRAQGFL